MWGSHHVLDACAHPVSATGDEVRRYMQKPWSTRSFPGPERYHYASPAGEYLPGSAPSSGLPGSSPDLLLDQLRVHGADQVILVPLTRGLLANVDLATAVCRATNDWLVAEWLTVSSDCATSFRGTLRVNPSDPKAAALEIERWAEEPAFVQVAVPMQSHHPYGQRMYLPVWEAAAAAGLPVLLHADGGASIDFPPSPAGYVRYSAEYNALYPINVAYHVASFIAEGVFEALPTLRVVCGEGALSAFTPILWRLDRDWRSTREEIPWVTRLPSDYVRESVRFLIHRLDLPHGLADPAEWWRIAGAKDMLVYAGNYPQWDYLSPADATASFGESLSGRVLWENGAELYGLRRDGDQSPSVAVERQST